MSISQDILIKIAEIAVPTFISPLITYIWLTRRMTNLSKELETHKSQLQSGLNKEIEDYKKGISRELENHKFQLQSTFQAKFYEFQTKYSLLHQKKAEAIEKLFELLAKVQNDLQIWAAWENYLMADPKDQFFSKTRKDFQELIVYYDEKRIFFDKDIGARVIAFVKATEHILNQYRSVESLSASHPDYADVLKSEASNLIDQYVHPIMNQLEERFRTLLSAEMQNENSRSISKQI